MILNDKINQLVADMVDLLKKATTAHATPAAEDYNGCDIELCEWCKQSLKYIQDHEPQRPI